MSALLYGQIYIISFFAITLLLFSQALLKTKYNEKYYLTHPVLLSLLLLFLLALYFAYSPIELPSDKENYRIFFLFFLDDQVTFTDIGWPLYVEFIREFTSNELLFFFITACIYISGYCVFIKKYIPPNYFFYFLVACCASFGFYSYGTNTIRSGIALSFLLTAFALKDKRILFFIFVLIAAMFHKSMLIPAAVFFSAFYIRHARFYLLIWILVFFISYVDIPGVGFFIQETFDDVDSRIISYISGPVAPDYKVGFRWDFVIYSVLHIIYGLYYMADKGFDDPFYRQIFNTYVGVNAVWLLMIRVPYTDRFAYLSWFLIPFILLYPVIKSDSGSFKNIQIGLIISLIAFFNLSIDVLFK
ncbi:MAG: EpsG family protein [Tannerella sp.]|jgi:hypothetical protein|nr:EpsG family protein [Tannerella sp.]